MAALPAIRLTDRQAAFVEEILMGKDAYSAAKASGLAATSASINRLLSAPHVLAAIEIGLRKRLHGQLVPLAFNVLHKLITSGESERVQLDAAKIVLDRGGFVPVKQSVADADETEPEHMTTDQLHARIAELEREIGERAKVIEPSEPESAW